MIRFDEEKATQTAALLLRLRGGQMHYLKLVKLLYLADRQALLKWGKPITTDRYVSMNHGPVVSRIYSLIVDEEPKPIWSQFISAPLGDYEVQLQKEAPTTRLSKAEEVVIGDVFDRFGHMNRWDIVSYVHTLPEWRDPNGSSTPIHVRDILRAGGENEQEINAILAEMRGMSAAEEALSNT